MVNVKSMFAAQKIKWINKYTVTDVHVPWKTFLDDFLSPYGGDLLFHCNIDIKVIKAAKNVPIFYKDLLIFYTKFVKADTVSPLQQCLWNNRHIRINHKPCYYKSFLDCGIIMVCDLFDTDGTIIPYDILVGRGLPRNLFLKWRGILSAIPSSWKHIFKQGCHKVDKILI